MSLSPAEFLLIFLEKSGGTIGGRTLLQKRVYFVQRIVAEEFVPFRPHYYGPFAPGVESAMGLLVELGFVSEEQRKVGVRERIRYDYALTNHGTRLAGALENSHQAIADGIEDAVSRISESGDLDYNQLSLAAKVAHILEAEGRSMTAQDITLRATELGWQFGDQNVMPIAKFLQSLGLVKFTEQSSPM